MAMLKALECSCSDIMANMLKALECSCSDIMAKL